MQTTLRIDGANCPTCFNDTLDDLARLDGVRHAHGSLAGPCIEVDHDVAVETITGVIRNRLHGVEMFANEIRMVPLEPVELSTTCPHQRYGESHVTPAPEDGDIDPTMTLGDIVTMRPSLAAELERRGLDYCCHGDRTLAIAARDAGLDAAAVARELSAAHAGEAAAHWAHLGPADLIDHIEAVHHQYLWAELPRITALLAKVVVVHGDTHAELHEVQRLYAELRGDIEPHLTREEQDLFPKIRQLVSAHDGLEAADPAIMAAIQAITDEHDTVGDVLEQLHRMTSGYETPADGCASYAACYLALAELEADTHLHVHKENNVLFPMVRSVVSSPSATAE
jgi:regulator of cell morphogenesis and NO signaling